MRSTLVDRPAIPVKHDPTYSVIGGQFRTRQAVARGTSTMCLTCVVGPDGQGALVRRARVLALLALVENSAGLPGDAALRLGEEILALVGAEPAIRQCEAVLPPGPVDSGAVARGHSS